MVVRLSLNGYCVSTTALTWFPEGRVENFASNVECQEVKVPEARVTVVSNGPKYRWTKDDWSGVITKEFVMNLGHPWGWFTVQHLCLLNEAQI